MPSGDHHLASSVRLIDGLDSLATHPHSFSEEIQPSCLQIEIGTWRLLPRCWGEDSMNYRGEYPEFSQGLLAHFGHFGEGHNQPGKGV
jgi:hypothetical protein